MPHDPRVRVGTAAVVVRNDKLLCLLRSHEASHGARTWGLPGGWLNFGEDPAAGCARELEEETGMRCLMDPEFDTYTHDIHPEGFSVVCLFFEFLPHEEDPLTPITVMEPDKHDDIRWIPLGDLDQYDLFAPLESYLQVSELFRRIRRRRK